jgi:hypothetical protein
MNKVENMETLTALNSLDIPLKYGNELIGSMNLYPEYSFDGERPSPGPGVGDHVPTVQDDTKGPIIDKVPFWPEGAVPKNLSDATVYMGHRIGTLLGDLNGAILNICQATINDDGNIVSLVSSAMASPDPISYFWGHWADSFSLSQGPAPREAFDHFQKTLVSLRNLFIPNDQPTWPISNDGIFLLRDFGPTPPTYQGHVQFFQTGEPEAFNYEVIVSEFDATRALAGPSSSSSCYSCSSSSGGLREDICPRRSSSIPAPHRT